MKFIRVTILFFLSVISAQQCWAYGSGVGDSAYSNLAVTPDGRRLIAENVLTRTIQVIDTKHWTVETSVPISRSIMHLVLSPDGKYCAAWNGNISIWTTDHWKLVSELSHIVVSKIDGDAQIQFLPDDSLFVSNDIGADIYKPTNGTFNKARSISADFGETERRLSPDGQFLACGGNGFLKVLSTKTWKQIACFQGIWSDEFGPQDASFLMFSPSGDILIAAAYKILHVFRTSDWTRVDESHAELVRYGADSADGAFSRDGSVFATVGHTVMFWDTRTGNHIGPNDSLNNSSTGINHPSDFNVVYLPNQNEVVVLTHHLTLSRWPAPATHN